MSIFEKHCEIIEVGRGKGEKKGGRKEKKRGKIENSRGHMGIQTHKIRNE